jgi:glycosyltransferase involved in cell wall biosynthesis
LVQEAVFFGVEDVKDEYVNNANAAGVKWYAVKKKPTIDIGSYIKVARILKKSNPDIVLMHSSSVIIPVLIARYFLFARFKIISRESQANHLKPKAQSIGLWIAMFTVNKIVLLSEQYKEEIKKEFGVLFQKRKITVIPNGIDLDIFKPRPGSTNNNIVAVGMQSRIYAIKDHATLLKAIALIKNKKLVEKPVHLFIAGDGNLVASLKQLSKELDIEEEVHFEGMLPESDLPLFINKLDIYVHATFGEAMSTAIMQVMACKKPIVASDVNGVNNMLTHEANALLVPVKDPEAMATAIVRLVNDPQLAYKLSGNAFDIAQNCYSNKVMFSGYKKIFAEMCGQL